MLPVNQFGEVQALFSILINITILFTALTIVIINVTANFKGDFKTANIQDLEWAALLTVGLGGVVWLLLASYTKSFLRMESIWPVIIFYAAVIVSLLTATRQAFLQGRQDFAGASLSLIIGAGFKLALSVIFVLAGLRVIGAVIGLVLGQLIGLWYTSKRCSSQGLRFQTWQLKRPDIKRIWPELRYGFPVLLVSLAITLLYSSDIITVKHYFNPLIAGQYAGIAAIGRIIFFATASIGAVMFASVKLENVPRRNTLLKLRSLMLISIVGGGVLAVFAVAPKLLVGLLIGARYQALSGYLPKLAAALFIIAVLNLLFYYDLALRRRRVAALASGAVALLFVFVTMWHSTPMAIIDDMIYTSVITLVITIVVSLPIFWPRETLTSGSR